MKKATRTPEVVRLRTYKLEGSPAPQLHLDQLVTPNMAFNHMFSDSSPIAPKQNGIHSPASYDNKQSVASPLSAQDSVGQNTPSAERIGSPPPPSTHDASFNSPLLSSNANTPTGDGNSPWSSAVGRATTGKSGRVIERLMTENDRLLREKKLATVKLEEETKRSESARSALESLQISNENLTAMHESDAALLLKRDRKIQDLKDELKIETSRREKAEKDVRESRRERDETVEHIRREAMEDKELGRRASSQYDVLSKSWKSLEERYERQVLQLRTTLKDVQADLRQDRAKMGRLEVIIEQLRKEEEKTRKAKDKLINEFDAYKAVSEQSLEQMRTVARSNESANDCAQLQLVTVLGEMKHVIGVQQAFHGPNRGSKSTS